SAGNVLWAKGATGTNMDEALGVSTDPFGNIFVTGYFASDTLTLGTISLTDVGVFIAKYDSAGNILWAKSAGGTSIGRSIATDSQGNVIVTGDFRSSTITFGATTLVNADQQFPTPDYFIVKYDSSGNALWAKRAGGNDNEQGNGIA